MQPTLNPATLNRAGADTPFRLRINPGEAFAHAGWRQARAVALTALDQGSAVVLLGLPGTGKTLLLRDLAQALRHGGRSARVVVGEDGLDRASTADVLLVDEAGKLSAGALARLGARNSPFVLAAVPSFAARLAGLARPVTTVALEPLPAEEVARFVAARLSAAGRPRDMLEPDAVFALAQHSAGLPRLVNVLGQAAVLLAELEHAPRVGRRHVEAAVAMWGGADEAAAADAQARLAAHPPLATSRRRATVAATAAGLGLLLAGGWVLLGERAAQPPVASIGDRRGAAESPVDHVGDQPRGAPSEEPIRGLEIPGNETSPVSGEHRPMPQEPTEAEPLPHAGPPPRPDDAPPQRSAIPGLPVPSQPIPGQPVPGLPIALRGPVYNETIRQGGQMSLVIRRQGPSGAVTARFEAWGGLLGSGELAGHLSEDGRLSASGQLMVGKNPFTCDLSGILVGDHLTGSATFVRSGNGNLSRSRFALTRS